ncbi:MAG TPA: ATP-binding protein [Sphingomonas sp.]|jgi:PAS domain S-box-containing protein|uniref:ATP-binding protein n=1 Tax=Sphingomonas sp. TaxID=28214 RepID=UPI002EDB2019
MRTVPAAADDVFIGNGEMARLMRATDWSATPLGPVSGWPEALKVALRLLLTSRFEMWLGWGPDVAFFYNDAYRPTLGQKHPQSLAMPARQLWPEIWEDIKDRIESVYLRGEATWDRALLLLMERNGYPEETYHTFSYSPLIGAGGAVEGLFCAVSEETERVVAERRFDSLRRLALDLAQADRRDAVLRAAERALAANDRDCPFGLIYLHEGTGARLVARAGIPAGHTAAPAWLAPDVVSRWPLSGRDALISLHDVADLPTGAWTMPPRQAAVIPLMGQGSDAAAGMLVVGLNPHRPHDTDYAAYLALFAGQISAQLASADAHESERQRAAALAEAVRLREAAADALRQANAGLLSVVEQRTAERDRLRILFERAPGFMCVLSGPDHVFEFMNEAYQQLVGHRSLVGLSLREAMPELAGQGFVEILDEVMRTGRPFVGRDLTVDLQRVPNGPLEERFVNLVYQPIIGADGSVTGIFAEGQDVTEQKHTELALRELNATLETRIETAVRERQEVEEALRQSQKMEAVGQLTGGIAHDFNNLLTGIIGSLDLMQRRMASGRMEGVERYITTATMSANRAAALTHRLLAFSRRQPIDPRAVDANRLMTTMEDLLRRTIGETVALVLELEEDLWKALCDPHQLESAVLNLAINARDAMPDGGRLTIATCNVTVDPDGELRAHDAVPGDYICVAVSDTGTGMTPDVIARAFEPFFTTKPIGQGTGLGLSMVYGFARQSEGFTRILSTPGEGTSIRIYIPRHAGGEPEVVRDGAVPANRQARGGEVVLVVEDEPAVRALVIEVLADLGYHMIAAHDGPAGLAVLESDRRIDLLVTDVGLPGMNGRQLADAARAVRPDLKILFMTGYAEKAAASGGFLEPGMEMVIKPFTVETLQARIAEIL